MDELTLLAGEDVAIGVGDLVDIIGEESTEAVLRQLRSQGVQPKAVGVVNRPYNRARRLLLGIPKTSLTTTGGSTPTATIIIETTNPIKLKRLAFPAAVASTINVTQLDIGSDKQIINGNPVPGETFRPDAMNLDISLDTLNPQIKLYLGVANLSTTAAVDVYGAFVGEAVR